MPPQPVSQWSEFENVIAQCYRILGADVQQNVNLAGHQVDIFVVERTPSGQIIRVVVECKFRKTPVGKDIVSYFAVIADFLKKAGLVDKATLVAYNGFTKDAFLAAKALNVDLVTFADLEVKVGSKGPKVVERLIREAEAKPLPARFDGEVFVLMPFAPELEDLYVYGIRGAVEKLGLKCVRADEIEHNADILKEILDHIRRAQFIVAEMSDRNPNVYYEVGWAHALEREIILLARKGTSIPFDLQNRNHIIYTSINDLEKLLSKRVKTLTEKTGAESAG